MDASPEVARYPGQGQSEVAVRQATLPSPPITPWGRQGTPPAGADTAMTVAPGPAARPPADQAHSTTADAIPLVRAYGSARPPSAGAGSSPDPAARAGRRDLPHGAAPVARREATAEPVEISQEELEDYYGLNQAQNRLKAECAKRRRDFLDRLQRGARAEPGPYKAVLQESMQSRVTVALLTEHLGEEYVEDLRQQRPRVKRVALRVTGPKKHEDRKKPRAKVIAQPVATDDDPGAW